MEMSANPVETKLNARIEAQSLIRSLAEPCPAGDSVKAGMVRAWRRLPSWTFNRVIDVWKADPRIAIKADEMDQLRRIAKRREEKAASNELAELRERLSRLERRMVQTDPDFFGPSIDQMRAQAGGLGGRDSAVDRGGGWE
jgi:hypothetical protein